MADSGRLTLRRRLLARLANLAPLLLRPLLRLLQASLRIEYVGAEELQACAARGEQAILAFWHNRQLMLPVVTFGRPACVLISQHRDGELATRVLSGWGIATVRGSATRGAIAAFRNLVQAYKRGYSVVVVPDGPRGPCYVAKPGVIRLARAVDAPIYPMAYAADRVRRLRSWDRMLVPLPFARVTVTVGAPLRVPATAGDAELEALRDELEQRLRQITAAADAAHPEAALPAATADAPPLP